MPQLILTITDIQSQALAHLETIDGQTPDQRYAKYHSDILQNEAKVDLSRPERAAARLAELAEDAQEAVQKREEAKEAAKKATQKAVEAEASTEKTVDVSGL